MQDNVSLSINRTDSSISKSKQLDGAIPASKISASSSGEFVSMVADDPDCKIELKAFHCEILNDHGSLKEQQASYKPLPIVRQVDNGIIKRNYVQIRQEIEDLVNAEMERFMSNS